MEGRVKHRVVRCATCGKQGHERLCETRGDSWFQMPEDWLMAFTGYSAETSYACSRKCAYALSRKRDDEHKALIAKIDKRDPGYAKWRAAPQVHVPGPDPNSINWPEGALQPPPRVKPRLRTWLGRQDSNLRPTA